MCWRVFYWWAVSPGPRAMRTEIQLAHSSIVGQWQWGLPYLLALEIISFVLTKTTAQCGRTWAPRNRRNHSTVGILPRFMYCRVNDCLIYFFFPSCSFLKDYGPQSLFQSDFCFFILFLSSFPSCFLNLDYVKVGVRAYGLLHVLPCYQQAEVPFFFLWNGNPGRAEAHVLSASDMWNYMSVSTNLQGNSQLWTFSETSGVWGMEVGKRTQLKEKRGMSGVKKEIQLKCVCREGVCKSDVQNLVEADSNFQIPGG